MKTFNLILIIIALIIIFAGVLILDKSCNNNRQKFTFTISMPAFNYVKVDSIFIDTVFINNSNNQIREKINFYHNDSLIIIKGYTLNNPPECSLAYKIKPITITGNQDTIFLSSAGGELLTLDITGSPRRVPRPVSSLRFGALRFYNKNQYDYYLGYGRNIYLFNKQFNIEAGVLINAGVLFSVGYSW